LTTIRSNPPEPIASTSLSVTSGALISGLMIVGLDLGGRHQDALLAVEHALLAAVEEEGDVRVLLGFGDAQLPEAGARHRLAEAHT
jgi:hypothetical protein